MIPGSNYTVDQIVSMGLFRYDLCERILEVRTQYCIGTSSR
jgi:hypothetical protein